MNHSNDLEQKQSYIYQNIMEADYDIQAFAQYLASLPPNHTSNLDSVPLQVVKKAVDTFIKKAKLQKASEKSNQKQSEVQTVVQTGKFTVDYNDVQDYYIKSRNCLKELNQFSFTSINLNIVSFKKNEGGMLSRDFITYKIQLPQFQKIIERRYSDFEWLRSILAYYHPGMVIPPLPKKKMKKIFTQNHLKKKAKMLQNFLRKCLQLEDLRNDDNMYTFLSAQNANMFQIFKKKNKVNKGFAQPEKIKSASGIIEYGITKELLNINKKGIQYFRQISPVMKLLYKQVKRVQKNLQVCCQHLTNLQGYCKKLIPTEQAFRRTCSSIQNSEDQQKQISFFQNFADFTQKYKQQIKGMKDNWQKDLYMKMKYEFHHTEAFIDTVLQYQSMEKQFMAVKQKLRAKKMKAFSRPMSQWQISAQQRSRFANQKPSFNQVAPLMMKKKTQELAQLQFYYALHIKQLNNSIVNYAKMNNIYNGKTLQAFIMKQHSRQLLWYQKLKNMMIKQIQFDPKEKINKNEQLNSSKKGQFYKSEMKSR